MLASAYRLLKKASECFENLSMNGKLSLTQNHPFVLSAVEGLRYGIFSNLLRLLVPN
jgi:hypothetical protein